MRPRTMLPAILLVLCSLATHLWGAPAPQPDKKVAAKAEVAPGGPSDTVQQSGPAAAPLQMFNRTVTVFRSIYYGVSPADRAQRARQEIERVLGKGGAGKVSVQAAPHGRIFMIDDELVFTLFPQDPDLLGGETLDHAAQNALQELTRVVAETREARDLRVILRAGVQALTATGILLVLVLVIYRAREWLIARLGSLAQQKSSQLRLGGEVIFHGEWIFIIVRRMLIFCYWLVILLLIYEWLGKILALFPYTRPWGERLTQYLLNGAGNIAGSMLSAIPNLVVAFVIFLIARGIIRLLKPFFDRVEEGQTTIGWLDRDTVRPTRRLVSVAIGLFALTMAYPYLPGAQTQAFKGLSVLVGLMVSLGASSLVGQAASGMILMFTRTLRPGEYVSINDKEGTVVELGLFNTRIRTGMGEELTMPNAMIIGTVTKNFSRTVQGSGFILSTNVTIGYDTPWRQIHAMLLEAARRTPGVQTDPPPRVFQVALSDYYPEYRLVCQAIPTTPLPRAEVLTNLHANIQDVFNEYGVQIMSPHYMADPAEAKVVAKDEWYAPPARPPGTEADRTGRES